MERTLLGNEARLIPGAPGSPRLRLVVCLVGLVVVMAATSCTDETPRACGPRSVGVVTSPFTARCPSKHIAVVLDAGSSEYGRVPCRVFDVLGLGRDAAGCRCTEFGYEDPGSVPGDVYQNLHQRAVCSGDDPCCARACICEMPQLSGSALRACQANVAPDGGVTGAGFCYVDPDVGLGVVTLGTPSECPSGRRAGFRVVGKAQTASRIVLCDGAVQ